MPHILLINFKGFIMKTFLMSLFLSLVTLTPGFCCGEAQDLEKDSGKIICHGTITVPGCPLPSLMERSLSSCIPIASCRVPINLLDGTLNERAFEMVLSTNPTLCLTLRQEPTDNPLTYAFTTREGTVMRGTIDVNIATILLQLAEMLPIHSQSSL